ncbi:Protein ANTHESIS POMOTING FACTOR 1 [Bienertia sinuspersici]
MMSLTHLDDDTVRSMSIGAVFSDFTSKSPLASEASIDSSLLSPKALTVDSADFETSKSPLASEASIDSSLLSPKALTVDSADFEGGLINSIDFHRTSDLLVTASADDSVRLYDIVNANSFAMVFRLLKTTYHKKHGADRICFTHHPSSVVCSSKYNIDSTGGKFKSLRYLSMYDNRCLRYFKGHKERIVSLCMSPINDSFMSGSLDHSVRIWDLRVNACQIELGILHLRGRPAVAYDQQGLVFAVAMEGGAVKLFDSRSYDKGPFDTFLVGGDTAEVCDIKFSNDGKSMLLTTTNNHVYILDAYAGEKRCGYSLEPSPNSTVEATFTPDGQYAVAGSGDGSVHCWNINMQSEQNGSIGPEGSLTSLPEFTRLMHIAWWTHQIFFFICFSDEILAHTPIAINSFQGPPPLKQEMKNRYILKKCFRERLWSHGNGYDALIVDHVTVVAMQI